MITFQRRHYDDATLIALYRNLVKPRLIEEKMLNLLRQGKISKWFSGIGQEAISVGATMALEPDEYIMTLHRNLGVFTTRGMPFYRLFCQWQGHPNGYSKGRERSFHFGSNEHHIVGMISHLGPQLAIANGIALAHKLRGEKKVALAFTGEGGTSEGDFHEALNVASVWDLPVIFVIENNGYGLSTPVTEQYRCSKLSDRAVAYGMEGMTIDGNNILEVYDTIRTVRDYCIREQRPYLVECMTFRMRGHEEASGTKYVPKHLFEEWARKDPIVNYEQYLRANQILTPHECEEIKTAIREEIEEGLRRAFADAPPQVNEEQELADIYAPSPVPDEEKELPTTRSLRFVDAIAEAIRQAMERHDNLILMGQDIAEYGGVFKVTEGLVERFGKDRVRNTPLCESAIVGAALGLSIKGFKSMVEMQFADFVTCGFNQIVNNLAKIHWRWGQHADVVIRMPTGAGVGAGPFHSQSNEAWFVHTPGLKVVYPSTPYDAKGLLLASFEDPNPIMYFEHKALYRSISGPVPEAYYTIPIGKGRRVRSGEEVTIITYGAGVHWALEDCTDVSADIIDLRSLLPWDKELIADSVKKTGKVLILHEDTLTGGIGGELAAWIGEHLFRWLDAPVVRCASLDTPVPFSSLLEQQFLARRRLRPTLQKLLNF
ncbi:MAG: dehydrogenase E1 component subunit alpha/beta [Chitinophagales bacterium]|nr:dehydrogenase E1 component subunit alpha/beta [Chitinophagales bacterium]MDW8427164.1 dehydrogenase E1 component subunit alpha/beta [Chitinophagales bacterium]